MEPFAQALALLPPELRTGAMNLAPSEQGSCEELRLRPGQSLRVNVAGRERPLPGRPVEREDLAFVLEKASRASLHSVTHQLRQGFLCAPGGLRLGLCGRAVMEGDRIGSLRDISSLCLRLPRERPGCAEEIFPALTEGGFASCLLYSPPGGGKTTLLRELIRKLSGAGLRVAVADEREEIAGGGLFDLGAMTDVMSAAPKARAAEMLLRSMNPQVLAMDEIGGEAEAAALTNAVGCGVRLLATAHGESLQQLRRRSGLGPLLAAGAFVRVVRISVREGRRSCEVECL